LKTGFSDPHSFDANPEPAFLDDADPDQGSIPIFYSGHQ